MKFTLKHVAAAVAIAATAPAFAVGTTSDLYLTVWEQAANATDSQGTSATSINESYTLDLNVTFAQLIANSSTNLFINQVVNDSYFSQLLGAGDTAALQFSVIGANTNAPATLVETAAVAPVVMPANHNSVLGTAVLQVTNFTGALNATGSYVNSTPGGASYNTSGDAFYQTNGLNTLTMQSDNNSGAVGTALAVVDVSKNGTKPATVANQTILPGVFFFGQQNGQYVLQYQVAAVPEPTGLALAAAGLGLIGFVGFRRRNS